MSSFRFFVQQLYSIRSISQKSFTSHLTNKRGCLNNRTFKKLHTSVCNLGYEASGKTTGTIVNKTMLDGCCVESVGIDGFVLPNGDELMGSVILFPHLILSWHVQDIADVNEESLSLFRIIEPRVDLIVLGYGNRGVYTPEVHRQFAKICKDLGMRFEALPTDQAIGVFNFLSLEHRYVAAALIPPKAVDLLKLDKRKKFSIDELDDDEDEDELQLLPHEKGKKLLN